MNRGILFGTTAAAIWGGMYVVSDVVLNQVPPFILLTLRLGLGAAALFLVGATRSQARIPHGKLIRILGVGLIGYGVSLGLQFFGTRLSTAANGAVITAATPAFIFIFSPWILKEKITRTRLFAVLLATLGVLFVINPREAQLSPDLLIGNLALFGAGVTWALYSVLVSKLARDHPVSQITFIAFFGGLPLAGSLGIWELQSESIGTITFGIILGILYLGVVSTAVAASLWNRAFVEADAQVVSLTFFAQPVVGSVLGALLLGQDLTIEFLIGGILIGLGIFFSTRNGRGVPKKRPFETGR